MKLVLSEVPPRRTGFHAIFCVCFDLSCKEGIIVKVLIPVKKLSCLIKIYA